MIDQLTMPADQVERRFSSRSAKLFRPASVNINFNDLGGGTAGSFGVTACGSGLPQNSSAALQFAISGASGGYSGNNYSAPLNLSSCPGGSQSRPYNLTLAVDNTQQTERVSFGFVANVSTTHLPGPYTLPVSGCTWEYNLTVGMLNGTPTRVGSTPEIVLQGNPSGSSSCAGGAKTFLRFGITEVPSGLKVRTWLWLPDDNSTLSSLPWGLKRYTSEQSFALVLVNNTNPTLGYSSDSIPLPWGGTATGLSFPAGLSELLIPRGEFVNSSLGESLLLNRTLPGGAKTFAPLLGATEGGAVVNGSQAGTLANLACYWQNRAVASGPPLCPGTYHGTAANLTGTVATMNSSGWTASNAGDLPASPIVETGSLATAAVSIVTTLNVSSLLVGNARQQIDALLAGLIDNTSGGVNGTFLDITSRLASMGLESAVVDSLANAVYPGGGNFGIPISRAVKQNPVGQGFGASFFNSPIGVLFIAGTWLGLADSAPFAAGLFLRILAFEFGGELHLTLSSRLVSGLLAIGAILRSAINAALTFLAEGALALLSPAIAPIKNCAISYGAGLNGSLNQAYADELGSGVTIADQQAFWGALGGCVFQLAAVLAAVVLVVITLTLPFEIGPGFLSSLLIGLVVTAVLTSGALPSGATGFNGATISVVQTFMSGLSGICTFFKTSRVYAAFVLIAAGGGSVAAYLSYEMYSAVQDDAGSAGGYLAVSLMLILDMIPLLFLIIPGIDSMPYLTLVGLTAALGAVAIGAVKAYEITEPEVDSGLVDFLGLTLAMGGAAFGGEVGVALHSNC
jgi:hypothetical protein